MGGGTVMVDRIISALLALGIASMIWLQTRNRDFETLSRVKIPLELTLPKDKEGEFTISLRSKPNVEASFQASPRRMREVESLLKRDDFRIRVEIPIPPERLQENSWEDQYTIEADSMPLLPPGVGVTMEDRSNRISYVVTSIIERQLPVRLVTDLGTAPPDLVLDPPSVIVRGPRDVIQKALFIPTQAAPVDSRPGSPLRFPPRIPIVAEIEGKKITATPSTVGIRQPARPQKTYEITDVPVSFLCPPNQGLRPRFINERDGKISVRVRGPIQDQPPAVYAFVDLTKSRFLAGLTTEPIQMIPPPEFQLEQEELKKVGIELTTEAGAKPPSVPIKP